jgi:hypothetical protein
MIAIGNQVGTLGFKRGLDGTKLAAAFVVVVTVTVTFSGAPALELTTYVFRGSVVVIAQVAFGALVAQEK